MSGWRQAGIKRNVLKSHIRRNLSKSHLRQHIRKAKCVPMAQPKTCHHSTLNKVIDILVYSCTGGGTPPGHTQFLHLRNL